MNISEQTLWARDTLAKAPKSQKGLYRSSFQNCIRADVEEGRISHEEAKMFLMAAGCYGTRGKALLKELERAE
jgi:hypothetical protein